MTTTEHGTDALDDALDRLAGYHFTDGPGMAVHAPMGAEALVALGYSGEVAGWVEGYKARHEPIAPPAPAGRLDPADERSWRPALGEPTRLGDWRRLFTERLADEPWPAVIATWVPRLLPGYGGAFTHGLIRTSHAVRALERSATTTPAAAPSPARLAELATGLAYWAGTHLTLPGSPDLRGDRDLTPALAALPRPETAWSMMEAAQFTRIGELEGFPEAVAARAAPAGPVDEALDDLTAMMARLMPAVPDLHPFALVHALTPVAGARILLPYLPPGADRDVYRRLWHVTAAITAGFVPRSTRIDADDDAADGGPPLPTPDELAARAVEHRDPHAVKYTAACLAEHRRRPDPALLRAADHVIGRAEPW